MTHSSLMVKVPYRDIWLVTCFFIIANTCCYSFSTNGFHLLGNVKESVVRFELINNLIVVPITLNGGIKTKAIVDTGVKSVILYGDKYRDGLDFTNSRNVKINGLGKGKKQQGALAINNTIRIGDVEGKGVGLVSIEEAIPFGLLENNGVDIILGYQLFSNFIIEIDYAKQKLAFHDPLTFRKDESAREFLMELIDTKPYITTSIMINNEYSSIQARNMKMLLDTGAALDMMIYNSSKNAKLFMLDAPKKLLIGHGMNGEIQGYVANNLQLDIGSLTLKDATVNVANRKSGKLHRKYQNIDGLIGGNVLKEYKVTFDYINGAVYLL